MRVETSLQLIPARPDAAAWTWLQQLAADWNARHPEPLAEIPGLMFHLRVVDPDAPARAGLLALLQRAHVQAGVRVFASSRRLYDAQDYRACAFVEIGGAALGSTERPFVVNGDEALGPAAACPACGWSDRLDAPQRAPFSIDESMLGDADCAELLAGHLGVSARLLAAWRDGAVSGLVVRPVLAAGTGAASSRLFQIAARRAVLASSSTGGAGDPVCAACGAALPEAAGPDDGDTIDDALFTPPLEFQVSAEQTRGDEVISRHPARGALLFVAQRAWRLVGDGGFVGVVPGRVMRGDRPAR